MLLSCSHNAFGLHAGVLDLGAKARSGLRLERAGVGAVLHTQSPYSQPLPETSAATWWTWVILRVIAVRSVH